MTRGTCQAPTLASQLWHPNALLDRANLYSLEPEDIARINPETRTLPIFRSGRDAEIMRALYRAFPVLGDSGAHSWEAEFFTIFHSGSASSHFASDDDLRRRGGVLEGNRYLVGDTSALPLYESKLVASYNHRANTFLGIPAEMRYGVRAPTNRAREEELRDPAWCILPRYWVEESTVRDVIGGLRWLLCYRDIINVIADARSLQCCIVPPYGVADTIKMVRTTKGAGLACMLLATLNSFVADYLARQKASGYHLSFYIMKQLPVIPTDVFERPAPWSPERTLKAWLLPRVLELTYTAWDLIAFARDCGYEGAPFEWEPTRRALIRAELDAACFHLYGIARDDIGFILDTFPVIRDRDVAEHGEYRTRRVVLEVYDAMAVAAVTGGPYRTQLDPPPADPKVAHPPRST
jgi:hypothetical protein